MLVYKDYTSYIIYDTKINIISNDTDYGRSTVAEINDKFYYLGDEDNDITTAIEIWQNINDKKLSAEQIVEVLIDNYVESLIPDDLEG